VANLQKSGPAALVRAWLEGDWSVIDGAFFPDWSNARHVVRPFAIPRDWLRFRSGDWGSAAPFSFGWWAVAGDEFATEEGVLPRGALVRYREWYGAAAPNVGLKVPAEAVADRIRALERDDGRIAYGVLDPAAFSSDGGPSIAERMARRGVHFRRADNARVAQRGDGDAARDDRSSSKRQVFACDVPSHPDYVRVETKNTQIGMLKKFQRFLLGS
jgi:hypothetical protein